MKIVHVIYSVNSFQFKELIAAFIYHQLEQGMEADIVHIIKENETSRILKLRNINVFTYTKNEGRNLNLVGKLSKLFKKNKYDVIHVHNLDMANVAGLAGRLAGIKTVLTLHCPGRKKVSGLNRMLFNKIVCASDYIRKRMTTESDKVNVVYNGIDTKIFDKNFGPTVYQENRRMLGLKDDSFVIGNVGHLTKTEDQGTILKAFRKLRQKGLNAEVVFTQEGPLQDQLQSFVRKNKLEDRVHFTANKIDKVEALQLFDLLVHSNNQPRYPFVLMEAMAAGTPVITTKIGTNPEVIAERKTGHLVPCGFPERIDSAIMRLNAIKTLPTEMGQAAKRHTEDKFTIEKMVQNYHQVYVG